ncbi:MAG: hypoxanthine phosphoribosyltransferase [Dehalococcoidia bacterium]|nr:hypoxanthine phosphoribosyltransferase [Dehalococcoidia bacterium]
MRESLRPLISREAIADKVEELARRLDRDYAGRAPLFLCVLKGAYVFLADLARRMETLPEVDFIQLSRYGLKGSAASPTARILLEPRTELEGRDVLVVEDIVDTGRSLQSLLRYLARRQPASVRVCSLLVRKAELPRIGDSVDYYGFAIEEGWVVGYGLDYSERYRSLPDISVLELDR